MPPRKDPNASTDKIGSGNAGVNNMPSNTAVPISNTTTTTATTTTLPTTQITTTTTTSAATTAAVATATITSTRSTSNALAAAAAACVPTGGASVTAAAANNSSVVGDIKQTTGANLVDAAAEQRNMAFQVNAKLCRLVRKCPWMYDRNHHNYAKKHILDKSWVKIARECNDSGEFINI